MSEMDGIMVLLKIGGAVLMVAGFLGLLGCILYEEYWQ